MNPFNGIEREEARQGRVTPALGNPFNGIESQQLTYSIPTTCPEVKNPFNGIERGVCIGEALTCVEGIHSMELKVLQTSC